MPELTVHAVSPFLNTVFEIQTLMVFCKKSLQGNVAFSFFIFKYFLQNIRFYPRMTYISKRLLIPIHAMKMTNRLLKC